MEGCEDDVETLWGGCGDAVESPVETLWRGCGETVEKLVRVERKYATLTFTLEDLLQVSIQVYVVVLTGKFTAVSAFTLSVVLSKKTPRNSPFAVVRPGSLSLP